MNDEVARRVQKNLVNTETTGKQDVGVALAKVGAGGLVWSALAMLPIIGVPAFIPILAILFIIYGGYLRFVA